MLLIMMIMLFSVTIFVVETKKEKYTVVNVMGVELEVSSEILVINNIFIKGSLNSPETMMFRGPPKIINFKECYL